MSILKLGPAGPTVLFITPPPQAYLETGLNNNITMRKLLFIELLRLMCSDSGVSIQMIRVHDHVGLGCFRTQGSRWCLRITLREWTLTASMTPAFFSISLGN